jgi:hypothetical protein
MMSCTKVARSTLLEPRFSPSNQIHSVHFEILEAGIGVPSRSAVARAARILKLDFPMNYNDDSAAGVSDREPMAEGETDCRSAPNIARKRRPLIEGA